MPMSPEERRARYEPNFTGARERMLAAKRKARAGQLIAERRAALEEGRVRRGLPTTAPAEPEKLDAMTLDGESFRALAEARGYGQAAIGSQGYLGPLDIQREPARRRIDPRVEQALERDRLAREQRNAERARELATGAVDCRNADPGVVADRLRQLGIEPSTVGILQHAPERPTTTTAEDRRARAIRNAEARVTNELLTAAAQRRPVNTKAFNELEFETYCRMRGLDPNGWGAKQAG